MRYLLLTAACCCLLATPVVAQELVAEGATPGQSIKVRDLKRDAAGNLTLRYTLINDSCCGVSYVMLRAEDDSRATKPSGVKLIDEATQTEYRPMRAADGQCVCSDMPNTGRGERADLWARFAGVPAAVRTMNVEVRTFEPVAGVPVTAAAVARELVAEGATPGQSIKIRDLKRDAAGNLMLRFTLINDSCCGVSSVMVRAEDDPGAKGPSGVKLVDEATQTEYRPMRGADGQCVCSEMPNTGRGERANLWVKFAGVPAAVKTASVELRTFAPVSGVPVTGP